jgi:methyl-accepting chemotaxis protein
MVAHKKKKTTMATEDKLSRKAEIDTGNFKAGIAEMNRELRVLESGFRASAASLGDWANDATGLEMRIKSLSSQMEIQEKKVAAVRTEYERIKAEKGENSRAAQDLEIKLNKETETLGKMQNELNETEGSLEEMRSSSDSVGESVEESGQKAQEAGEKFEGFKSVLGGIGSVVRGAITVVAGLAVAVASVGASISALVLSSADAAAQLVDMSAKTGISTTRLQEYSFIADQVGTSLDTITGANARLIRSMDSAREQTGTYAQKLAEAKAAGEDIGDIELGDAAAAFQALGVQVTDANGNLRDNEQVFADVIDALGRVGNESERDALAMQIFGKGAQEINPLVKAGADEMARLADQAHQVGAVMSEEDVAALESFDDSMSSLQAGLKGTLGTLATAFLPGFQEIFSQAGGYLQEFKSIVDQSDGDIGQIAQGVGGLIGQIVTDLAGQAPQLLQAGLGLINSLLGAIITALPTLLPAAVQIITSLIDFILQALPTLIQAGVQILLTLVQALISNLPMLIDAGLQAIIALALGLAAALPELIPAIVQALITIVQTLVGNIPMLVDAALQLILGLAQGLIMALPILIPAIPQIIVAVVNALIESGPMIMSAAGELIGMLVTGIVANIPLAVLAIGQLIAGLGDALAKWIKTAPEAGKNFIKGIGEGINNAASWLYDVVRNVAQSMIDSILNVFQQHSPSRVGVGIGNNFFRSIGMGGMESVADVEQTFAQAARRLVFATANGFPAGSAAVSPGAAQNSESYAFYAPVYFQGSEGSLGEQVRARRF